mgnify:CR=1 FL=1
MARAGREDGIYPISAITGEGLDVLLEAIATALAGHRRDEELRLDFADGRRRAWLFAQDVVVSEEQDAAAEYRMLGLDDIADEEEAHEENMIGMLDEERLRYSGSVVLGMSDALVELTGALAGLTFALQSLNLVALAGLVTGISAAFSMGASEYLSSRTEKKSESAVKAAFFTWISYLITVLMLVSPYLLFSSDSPDFQGLEPHIQALVCTFIIGLLIVAVFNFYVSVVEEVSFRSRFIEMAAILGVVSLISYGIGIALRGMLGVEV